MPPATGEGGPDPVAPPGPVVPTPRGDRDRVGTMGSAGQPAYRVPVLFANRKLIMDQVAALRLPASINGLIRFEVRGFVAYRLRFDRMHRIAIARISKPAK
jgi:hypothetical protein